METGPRFRVPSDGLEKPGIEPPIPGLQGKIELYLALQVHIVSQVS